jgi:hypothetical protein
MSANATNDPLGEQAYTSQDRNFYGHLTSAANAQSLSWSAAEETASDVSSLYSKENSLGAQLSNNIIESDTTIIENIDSDDTNTITQQNAENNKDSNLANQQNATFQSFLERANKTISSDSDNLSNVFSMVQRTLDSLTTVVSAI